MDKNKYATIASEHHIFNNPIRSDKMDKIIEFIDLTEDSKVIEIGAGNCELLIRLVEKYNAFTTAIELYKDQIDEGTQRAKERISSEKITFIHEDAKSVIKNYTTNSFDLAICIGATHAIGDLDSTLETLRKCVRKGGYILIADCFWKKEPSQEYLRELGGKEVDYGSHYDNIEAGENKGLIPIWSYTASDDEWDEFEWLYVLSVENYCYKNSDDKDCADMLNEIRRWKKVYNKWGRETLGFGIYLFRV